MSRARKKRGIHRHWWNIANEVGHQNAMNIEEFHKLEKITSTVPHESNCSRTFAVNVPRWRHDEKVCKEAKEADLDKFDEFDVFEETEDHGQSKLGCHWVITEKLQDGSIVTKARLTIKGDQDKTDDMRKDSPTVHKNNIKVLLLLIAACRNWSIQTCDVSSSFLQSKPIERDVFVQPPKERRVPGQIWKLKKTVNGLADASRGFYLAFREKIVELSCETSLFDSASILWFEDGSDKRSDARIPSGIAVTHVDDILHAGNARFNRNIIAPMKRFFKFGTDERLEFIYVGLNIKQRVNKIFVDQVHYIQALETPDIEQYNSIKSCESLPIEGQKEFRSAVTKLSNVGYTSRLDVVFFAKALGSKYGIATKNDLRAVSKKFCVLKRDNFCINFPD